MASTGQSTTSSGVGTAERGLGDLTHVGNYFKTALNGDTDSLMKQSAPQIDAIGKQFSNVRNMIATQPRGGGKTSELASLPIEQIKALMQIITGARSSAAQGLAGVAGQEANVGLNLGQLGLGETGAGLGATGNAAGLAEQGRESDIANGWGKFFKNLAGNLITGAGQGAGGALVTNMMKSKPIPTYGPGN